MFTRLVRHVSCKVYHFEGHLVEKRKMNSFHNFHKRNAMLSKNIVTTRAMFLHNVQ